MLHFTSQVEPSLSTGTITSLNSFTKGTPQALGNIGLLAVICLTSQNIFNNSRLTSHMMTQLDVVADASSQLHNHHVVVQVSRCAVSNNKYKGHKRKPHMQKGNR